MAMAVPRCFPAVAQRGSLHVVGLTPLSTGSLHRQLVSKRIERFMSRDLQPVNWRGSIVVWSVFGPYSSLSGVSAHAWTQDVSGGKKGADPRNEHRSANPLLFNLSESSNQSEVGTQDVRRQRHERGWDVADFDVSDGVSFADGFLGDHFGSGNTLSLDLFLVYFSLPCVNGGMQRSLADAQSEASSWLTPSVAVSFGRLSLSI